MQDTILAKETALINRSIHRLRLVLTLDPFSQEGLLVHFFEKRNSCVLSKFIMQLTRALRCLLSPADFMRLSQLVCFDRDSLRKNRGT